MDFWDLHRRMNDTLRDFWLTPAAYDYDIDDPLDWVSTPQTRPASSDTRIGPAQSRALTKRYAGDQSLMRTMIPRVNLDLIAEKDHYLVNAEVPGVRKEDLQVSVKDGMLSISGHKQEEFQEKKDGGDSGTQFVRRERTRGSFTRSLRLPDDASDLNIAAKHDNGILRISIPRQEPKKAKKGNIAIQ